MTQGKGMGGHQSPVMVTPTWLTPPHIMEALGEFDLDPCTPPTMPWRTARERYTEEDDGLTQPWFGRVWMNPPYNRQVDQWLEKMVKHGCGIALIFARTETASFFKYVWHEATAVLFIEGRLFFHDQNGVRAKSNSGAPSVLVAYGDADAEVLRSCRIGGMYVDLRPGSGVLYTGGASG